MARELYEDLRTRWSAVRIRPGVSNQLRRLLQPLDVSRNLIAQLDSIDSLFGAHASGGVNASEFLNGTLSGPSRNRRFHPPVAYSSYPCKVALIAMHRNRGVSDRIERVLLCISLDCE